MTTVDQVYSRIDELPARFAAAWAEQMQIERAREQERLRTVKPMRWTTQNVLTPAPAFTIQGPALIDEGWTADVRVIAARLSAADTLAAFVGENSNGAAVLGSPAASAVTGLNLAVILIPKSSGILNGGESVFLQTGAANIVKVWVSGWQVAGPEIGKLF